MGQGDQREFSSQCFRVVLKIVWARASSRGRIRRQEGDARVARQVLDVLMVQV